MANLSFITSLNLRGDIEYHLYGCLLPFLLSLFAALSPGHISSTLSGSPLNSSRGLTPVYFNSPSVYTSGLSSRLYLLPTRLCSATVVTSLQGYWREV